MLCARTSMVPVEQTGPLPLQTTATAHHRMRQHATAGAAREIPAPDPGLRAPWGCANRVLSVLDNDVHVFIFDNICTAPPGSPRPPLSDKIAKNFLGK